MTSRISACSPRRGITAIRVVVLTVLLLVWGGPQTSCSAGRNAGPNILLINADDHRADGIHALGNPVLKTPNLDRLVERGFVFRNAYTMGSLNTGAVCLPSRTQLLTGLSLIHATPIQYAGAPRAGKQGKEQPKVDPDTFFPRVLSVAGFETFHVGKPGNEFRAALAVFDTNLTHADQAIPERRLSSRRHADEVIEFLRSRKQDRPFFIYLAPPVPHDPRAAEEQFHKLYNPETIPLPKSYLPQHPFDDGDMTVRDEKLLPWPRTEAAVRKELADYYACITGLDYHLGRVFDCLQQLGQLDNTIIFFFGDNGLSVGEHGLLGKQNLYEFGGMHVPLVIAGPGIKKGESRAIVYHMDLLPTVCDLTGAKAPPGIDGKSLLPVLQGRADRVREYGFTAYLKCQRAIRDQRWKLIRYPLIDKTQFFDLESDPHELKDLAAEPQFSHQVAAWMAKLEQQQKAWGDTTPLRVEHPAPAAWSPPDSQGAAKQK